MLKRVLQDVLSEKENEQLISAFDQIGDIIIVRIPDSLVAKKQVIGKTLLEQVSTANSVFYQSSPVEGDLRTRPLEVIAGEDKTQREYY
jgi:tRNA (guanine37-N1)-methyltransferase